MALNERQSLCKEMSQSLIEKQCHGASSNTSLKESSVNVETSCIPDQSQFSLSDLTKIVQLLQNRTSYLSQEMFEMRKFMAQVNDDDTVVCHKKSTIAPYRINVGLAELKRNLKRKDEQISVLEKRCDASDKVIKSLRCKVRELSSKQKSYSEEAKQERRVDECSNQ